MTAPLTNVIVVASPRITDARLLGLVDPLERIAAILWGTLLRGPLSMIGGSIRLGATATTQIARRQTRAKDIVIPWGLVLAAA